jgi:ribosomal protein S18 acetylase RimI-like enzyme
MIDYSDATPADGPALDAMARACWVETFGASYDPVDLHAYLDEAYGPNGRLLAHLPDPAYAFRIARDGRAIAGYAKLSPRRLPAPDAHPHALELSQLYVLSAWQGRGVAVALMDWTIATARARGAPELYLSVWEENARARRFYDRYGFQHVGDYAFPVGRQIDRDLVLKLPL